MARSSARRLLPVGWWDGTEIPFLLRPSKRDDGALTDQEVYRHDGLRQGFVQLPCPEKAKEVMEYLRLFVGEATSVQLDANQTRANPVTLYEGPIESILDQDIGLLEAPARLGFGQLRKRPESKPGIAILEAPRAGVYIVDEFR